MKFALAFLTVARHTRIVIAIATASLIDANATLICAIAICNLPSLVLALCILTAIAMATAII